MRKVLGILTLGLGLGGCVVTGATGVTTSGAQIYSNYQQVSLSVTNATAETVCYLYISPVSDPNWGPDQLGSRVLSPGETDSYALYAGQWDIRADDCNHNQLAVLRNQPIGANAQLIIR
ncbi:MAG: hypothetical protein HY909_27085 [Deltaproteobacteria bacterium]|jgi:hypothetical protein|nr:hypothetical protein [Deltaproteobacteria bacterium]